MSSDPKDALAQAVSKMLSAFVSQPSTGRIDSFVEALDSQCPRCGAQAARELSATSKRTPVPADLVEATKQWQGLDQHTAHLGDAKALGRADVEMFWRMDAAPVIEQLASGLGAYIAAHMWWLEISPTLHHVNEEMASHRDTWVGGARSYLTNRDPVEETERMFAMARRNSVYPVKFWTDAEFEQMSTGNFRAWEEAGRP